MATPKNPAWTLGSKIELSDGTTCWRPRRKKSLGAPGAQVTRSTQEEAEAWIAEDRARFKEGGDAPAGSLTLAEYFARNRSWIFANLKPNTRNGYDIQWRLRVEPRFGGMSLDEITPRLVRAWVRLDLAHCNRSTVRYSLATLSKILGYAEAEGDIDLNPVPGVYKLAPSKIAGGRVRVIEPRVCLAIADEIDERCRTLVHVMAFGGLRINEALALDAADLQPIRGGGYTIDVHKNMTRIGPSGGSYGLGTTKTLSSNRIVPVRHVLEFDRAIEQHFYDFGRTSPMFLNARGGQMLYTNFLKRNWKPTLEGMGLELHTPHDLRHTAASLWISFGYSVVEIAKWLGHSDPSITLRIYAHLFDMAEVHLASSDDDRIRRARRMHGLDG